MSQTATHKKALIAALEKSLGIVTTACKAVGVDRRTFYRYYNNDPKFKSEVDDIGEIALDFAESQLHKKIQSGSDVAVIFYLKTKGKKRGYIERTELTGADGEALKSEVKTSFDPSALPDDVLLAIAAARKPKT